MPSYGETGRALFDQQQADAGEPRLTGTHRDGIKVRTHTTGDKGFAAIDPVKIAIAHGAGLQVGDVGAAAGLGDGQGADFLSRQHLGQHTIPHFGVCPLENGRQADIQRPQAGHQPA
ncbi:hypothetical protein D9M73_161250 [compost metagenome]